MIRGVAGMVDDDDAAGQAILGGAAVLFDAVNDAGYNTEVQEEAKRRCTEMDREMYGEIAIKATGAHYMFQQMAKDAQRQFHN